MRPTTSPGPFSMGGLRLRGVKLRDLGVDLLTYPPIEKGPKGCRELHVTVVSRNDTKWGWNGALCGSLLPQRTTRLA